MSKARSETQILQSFSDALVSVVRDASDSVVQVSSGRGIGTGVVWDKEGLVATNSHVIGRASKLEVAFVGGERLAATVVGQDRFSDVAVLKIEKGKTILKPIERGDSEDLATGQFVLALANPYGDRVGASSGIITNPRGRMGGPWSDNLVITDVRLNRGYSGGPLLNASGRMIGMNAAMFANRGIAIPIRAVSAVIAELSKSGSIKRAYLGIISNPITLPEESAKELGQNEGLIVLSVEPGTPAKKAGVAVGDILVKLDSKRVESYFDLHGLLTSGVIGKETALSVLRGEKLTELKITPVEA
ncbi:MAG: S1C family serine protease [Nitrososphaerales archaeon]